MLSTNTNRKSIFYDNFVSTWTHHSKHSCHIGPFSFHIGHFLSFWTVSQKAMFSTSEKIGGAVHDRQSWSISGTKQLTLIGVQQTIMRVYKNAGW